MLEATLEFACGTARTEPSATVDLAAMVGDLVANVGGDRAALIPSAPVPATVRPHAFNRALRNLIDNAVRYGGTAEVTLAQEPGFSVITVADTVRHRTQRTKGALSQKTVKLMVFTLIRAASQKWRRLNGANQLPRGIEGVKFTDGVANSDPAKTSAA